MDQICSSEQIFYRKQWLSAPELRGAKMSAPSASGLPLVSHRRSTRIRFCFKTKFFLQLALPYQVLKTLFCSTGVDALKTEVFENDYFTVLDTSTSHVPVKDGTVFNQYYVFAQTGNNDSKTQRVDADFFKNGAKNLRFQTNTAKTDTYGRDLLVIFVCADRTLRLTDIIF